MMKNQQILDNAPEGATHVDNEGDYWLMHPDNSVETFMDGDWLYCNPQEPLRSLTDIKRIAELEVALKRLLDVTLWVDSGCKQLGAAEQAAREALKEHVK